MEPPSYIELSKSALKQNISYLKKRIGKSAQFVSVIKGNAYGHGIEFFLPLAESCGADYFAVSDSSEAERALKVKNPDSRLMIMNMISNSGITWAIENGISFFVFDFERLEKVIEASKISRKSPKIHIELETGLNRTGFSEESLPRLIEKIRPHLGKIEIEGVCTHYAGAESVANYFRVQNQIESFGRSSKALARSGIRPKYYHTACSAAALTYKSTIMDMARFGIAQYGFWPSRETRMHNMLTQDNGKKYTKDPLKRTLSWKSSIVSINNIKAGEFVGYGTSYMAQENMRTAIIPVGYYHGFSRNLSNLGHVLIEKKKAPVVGMVNMNMVIVDITSAKSAVCGSEAVIIGRQGRHEITVASFSDLANYANYEMLVRLPYEIPRLIVE